MRLTCALCWRGQHLFKTFFRKPRDLTYQFRLQWKFKRRRKIVKPDDLLNNLHSRGISVVTDPWREMEQIYNPRIETKENTNEKVSKRTEKAVEWYDSATMMGGLEQAQHITKTINMGSLTPHLATHTNIQHELVQQYMMNSLVYDAIQKKLPRKIRFDLIPENKLHHDPPRDYGVPQARSTTNMMWNLLRFCESYSKDYPKLEDRSIVEDVRYCVIIRRLGTLFSLSSLRLAGQFSVLSSDPLKPLADSKRVLESRDEDLPDIFPINEAVNLKKILDYPEEEPFPVPPEYCHPHPHTVIFPLHTTHILKIRESDMQARALIYSFLTAVSAVRNMPGNDVIEPVTVQCVHTDGRKFVFSRFQLNTLSLDSNCGIKNMFWVDPRSELYDVCNHEQGLQGYNPAVIQTFLDLYLNGA